MQERRLKNRIQNNILQHFSIKFKIRRLKIQFVARHSQS